MAASALRGWLLARAGCWRFENGCRAQKKTLAIPSSTRFFARVRRRHGCVIKLKGEFDRLIATDLNWWLGGFFFAHTHTRNACVRKCDDDDFAS